MSEQLRLWFFRDLDDDQRLKLFGLFGLPVGEIGSHHGRQSMALEHITKKLVEMVRDEASPAPQTNVIGEYLVWSNEHKCWWGPDHAGYVGRLADAGRYTREEAIKICVNARGGRQFNSNPSEVPLPLADAELFWPDDKEEWRIARFKHDHPELWEEEDGY